MSPVLVVYVGLCVGDEWRFFHSRSYAGFLQDLVGQSRTVRYFGSYGRDGCELPVNARKSAVSSFVLPTYSEGLPRSLCEAMTFAAPIVTTEVGGIPLYLGHRSEAYLVQPGDTAALAQALALVTEDGELRRTMIRNARAQMLGDVFERTEREESLANQIWRCLEDTVPERPEVWA